MAVSREIVTGSEVQQGNRCAAGALWCTSGMGKGGSVTVSGCLAGVRGERSQAGSGCTGTPLHALRGLGVLTGVRRRGRGGAHDHGRVIPF
jgi:hypothetical protein